MAISYKVGAFAKDGTAFAGTPIVQHVTGVGFQPKVVLFFYSQSNTSLTDIMRPCIGWATGNTTMENFGIAWGADDNTATVSNTWRRASNAYVIWGGSASSAAAPLIKVTAMESDGFELTYDNNDTNTFTIEYIAIAGTDVTGVKAGSFVMNTTTGNQDITWSNGGNWGTTGSPSVVFFMGANSAVPTAGQSISHCLWNFGVAKNSAQQGTMAGMSVDAVNPTVTNRYQRTDRCIAFGIEGSSPGLLEAEASFVSTLTNGFRINVIDAPNTGNVNPIFYLAIQGGTFNVGNLTQPATTGVQAYTVTNGIPTPKGLFLFADCATTNTAINTQHRFFFGAGDGTNKWNIVGGDQNAVGPAAITVRGTNQGTGVPVVRTIIEAATGNTTDVTGSATLQSFDTDTGFSLNWTDVTDSAASTAAREIIYLTASDSPSGSALVKNVTDSTSGSPPSLGITEAIIKKLQIVKNIIDSVAGTPPALALTEAVNKALGKVKVVGNTGSTGTGSGGFTSSGFLSSGFTTTSATTGDYVAGDFNPNDFLTDVTPLPDEGVAINESIIRVIAPPIGIINPTDLIFRYSGGSGYTGTGGATGSIGGGISNTPVPDNTLNAVWDDTGTSESSAGDTEYRCLYLRNAHATLTATNVKMWIQTNTPAGDEIQIAVGGSAVNGSETAATDENTLSPATPSTPFVTAPDESSAITLGTIPAGQHRAFWVKRIVPAATTAFQDDSYTLRLSFVSDYG